MSADWNAGLMLPCKMYPIHDYHLYLSSAGAQADVRSLYYISHHRDVSLAKLLLEKGESKYSTDSNELFVLTGFMLTVCQVVGVFTCRCGCVGVYVCGCVCMHEYMCELQNFK